VITALRAAALCAAAYDPASSWGARWETGDVHVFLAEEGDDTVIVHRGTDPGNLEDWLADLDLIADRDPILGAVLFAEIVEVRRDILRSVLGRSPVITGHSKGGAEAQALAGFFCAVGVKVAQLETFGAPRLMAPDNARLPALLGQVPGRDHRHRDDPVPLLPLGFVHPRAVDQLFPARLELPSDALLDHEIANYVAALKSAGNV
jgi:hypothetical protein